VNRRRPPPLPNANFHLLPCARQFIASFPIFSTTPLRPLVSIPSHRRFSFPSCRRRPHLPAQVMSGSGWDEPPGGKRQRSTPKEPIANRYHESMGWGNLHYPSVENIVERVDILSAARLAAGMVGIRRASRGTPNLPLDAPGLLLTDESSWPNDSDAQVRVTRFSILLYIYILISCLFMFLQSTDLSVEHLACIDFLDTPSVPN
jgi:hypothetical protein